MDVYKISTAMTETILDIIGGPGDWERVHEYIYTELSSLISRTQHQTQQAVEADAEDKCICIKCPVSEACKHYQTIGKLNRTA